MFIVYTQDRCNFCIRAKMLLDSKGETYEEININENQEAKEKLKELGFKTVVIINTDEMLNNSYKALGWKEDITINKLIKNL